MNNVLPETLLRRRARACAAPRESEGDQGEYVHLVRFDLGSNHYALPATSIREVIPPPAVTPLPGLPTGLTGVFNFRGQLLGMLDPGIWLHQTAATRPAQVLIMEHGATRLGVLLQQPGETLACPTIELSTRTAPYDTEDSGRFTHVILLTDGPLLILDPTFLIDSMRCIRNPAEGIPA